MWPRSKVVRVNQNTLNLMVIAMLVGSSRCINLCIWQVITFDVELNDIDIFRFNMRHEKNIDMM